MAEGLATTYRQPILLLSILTLNPLPYIIARPLPLTLPKCINGSLEKQHGRLMSRHDYLARAPHPLAEPIIAE